MSTTVDGAWSALFEGAARAWLEADVLPAFLPKQRWFGGKARRIGRVRIADAGLLVTDGGPAWLVLVEVAFADGARELYSVPLAILTGSAARRFEDTHQPAVLTHVSGPDQAGILYDAMADDATCQSLLAAMHDQAEVPTRRGVIRAITTKALPQAVGPDGATLPITRGSAEQSNTSILFSNRLIFKLFRRLQMGPNPDVEIGRYLAEETSFEHVPRLAGALEYAPRDGEAATLGILQELVPNEGDGWKFMLEELTRYFQRVAVLGAALPPTADRQSSVFDLSRTEPSEATRDAIGLALQSAATLGKRTADMHLALASARADPAFVPEPLSRDDLSRLAKGFTDRAMGVLDDLEANFARLPAALAEKTRLVCDVRPRLRSRFQRLANADVRATKIRIHGDYHLGQVLVAQHDFVILDFEGEPAKSLAERRAKSSPLKDVAGMLRSFSYATQAGLIAYGERHPGKLAEIEPWAHVWETWVSAVFLNGYRRTAGGASFLPPDETELRLLLEAFLLDKALYELGYEMNNRPTWVRIPFEGVLELASA